MSKIFGFNLFVLAALIGAVLSTALAASYCKQDQFSAVRDCGFDTMDQCVAAISGSGGGCVRAHHLAETSASRAFVPRRHGRASGRAEASRKRLNFQIQ